MSVKHWVKNSKYSRDFKKLHNIISVLFLCDILYIVWAHGSLCIVHDRWPHIKLPHITYPTRLLCISKGICDGQRLGGFLTLTTAVSLRPSRIRSPICHFDNFIRKASFAFSLDKVHFTSTWSTNKDDNLFYAQSCIKYDD